MHTRPSSGTYARVSVLLVVVGLLMTGCTGVRFGDVPGSRDTTAAPGVDQTRTADATPGPPAAVALPEGFPSNFPVHKGNLAEAGVSKSEGNKPVLAARIQTATPLEDVRRFYLSEPQKTGWSVKDAGEGFVGAGVKAYFVEVYNASYHGVVRISEVNGLTTIDLNVTVENQ